MAKILLGWEYGSGMGHIALLMPVAKALQARGHEIVLGLRDVVGTEPMTRGTGMRVNLVPYLDGKAELAGTTHTLADIFHQAGFMAQNALLSLGIRWHEILTIEKPDMVICELSPTLAMASIGRIPTVTIGTGYSNPPAGRMMPDTRFWNKDLPLESVQNEQRLQKTISDVRKYLGLNPLPFFSDVFGGDASFVCTYPELDCYRDYRSTPAIGPLNTMLYKPDLETIKNTHPNPSYFAYLNYSSDHIENVLNALKTSGIAGEAYIRGIPAAQREAWSDDRLHIHATPQPMEEVLKRVAVCIHHAGISTSEMCLRYGVPQLLLPRHLEQRVNASSVYLCGSGLVLTTMYLQDSKRIQTDLRSLIENSDYRKKAIQKAEEIAARMVDDPLENVVERCVAVLSDSVKSATVKS